MSDSNGNRSLTPRQRAWARFRRNRAAVAGAVFLAIVFGIIFVAPFLKSYDPTALHDSQFQPPGAGHWFGTDIHGRDMFSRVVYGARISLCVGGIGALVSLVIGTTWGSIAGYLGGRWDNIMMRIVDVLYALPSTIFLMVLIATTDGFIKTRLSGTTPAWSGVAGFVNPWARRLDLDVDTCAHMLVLFVGLGAISWLTMARIVRGEVLSLRHRSFVEASRVLGASHAHVLWRHIIPNVSGVILVYLAMSVPSVILYESFLSYLGLGVQQPQASWGSLIAEGASQINGIRIYWWLLVFPGGALVSTLMALNFATDGLREALDPRTTQL